MGVGEEIVGIDGQLGQRFLPFGVDPMQAQFAPQGFFGNLLGQYGGGLGGLIGGALGNQVRGQQIGGLAGQLGQRFLPFGVDPMQAQFAPQGFFGNLLGQYGGGLGGFIVGALGNQGLGQQIGGLAGQLGQRFLPFGVDPMQAQFAPQGFFGNLLGQYGGGLGGLIGGALGNQCLDHAIGVFAGQLGQRFLPFGVDPMQAQFAP